MECAWLAGYDWGGRAACIVSALHPDRDEFSAFGSSPQQAGQPGSDRPGGLELGPQLADLGVHLGQHHAAALPIRLEL